MSRSYKICPVDFFTDTAFADQALHFSKQLPLRGVPQEPHTTITKAMGSIGIEDFRTYAIEHEREVTQRGRFNDQTFNRYIQMSEIACFYSEARSLLILSGRKHDILDFCSRRRDSESMRFTTVKIDMNRLLEQLTQVRLVWFRHDADASIQASALMAAHREDKRISGCPKRGCDFNPSFFIVDSVGPEHCVLVTSDGAIVPQGNYEPSLELELVLWTKDSLLDPLISLVPFDRRVRSR